MKSPFNRATDLSSVIQVRLSGVWARRWEEYKYRRASVIRRWKKVLEGGRKEDGRNQNQLSTNPAVDPILHQYNLNKATTTYANIGGIANHSLSNSNRIDPTTNPTTWFRTLAYGLRAHLSFRFRIVLSSGVMRLLLISRVGITNHEGNTILPYREKLIPINYRCVCIITRTNLSGKTTLVRIIPSSSREASLKARLINFLQSSALIVAKRNVLRDEQINFTR